MMDYQNAVQAFDLESTAKQMLSGSLDALNACYECCDRLQMATKLRCIGKEKTVAKSNIPSVS